MSRKWALVLPLIVLVMMVLVLLPVIAGRDRSPRSQDISNLKQLALATIMYAVDHDDRLPLASSWLDQVGTYLKEPAALRCAHLPKDSGPDAYGHVLEQSMPGRRLSQVNEPANVPMLFDGKDLTKNAVASILDMRLTRFDGKLIFSVALTDGHVRARPVPVFDRD